ncbi:MAG: biotin transporter BioY [Acidimicrobiaceae bacterium]|nr:biotin transporter BioY [Acidimicrobiaceae bacterium]
MTTSVLSVKKPRVLADLVGGSAIRDAVLVVGYAAFIGIFAQISVHLSFTPVPVTGQTFAVLIGAAALGWARAGAGTLLYALAGLAGVPWFAGGSGGVKLASAPTFGYIVGFIICSLLVGMLAKSGWDRKAIGTVLAMVLGNVVIYAFGVSWLAASIHVTASKAISLGMTPFLVGDLIKIMIATVLLPGAWYGVSKFSK